MPRILITGGCGFIGSNLAIDLVGRGYAVTVLDNLSRHGSDVLFKRVLDRGVSFIHGDVRDVNVYAKLDQDYAAIIICSAQPSVLAGARGHEARDLLDVNLQGAINCFEWARERKVPVIFMSSSRVYPYDVINACCYEELATRFQLLRGCSGVTREGVSLEMPLTGLRSLYGASKLSAELILQEYAAQYNFPAIINRCGVVSGPWQLGKAEQGVFAFWVAGHYFRKPLNYSGFGGSGKQVRDLLHIDDLADLIARQIVALSADKPGFRGETFNAGGSLQSNLSLRETSDICAELTGNNMDVGIVLENRPADLIWYITDNGRAGDVFGWKPARDARKTLTDVFQWIRDNEADCRKIFGV